MKKENPQAKNQLANLLTLVLRLRILFFSSTLKMEAIRSSETSVNNIYTVPHPRRLLSSVSQSVVLNDRTSYLNSVSYLFIR
jgi:hypothetical protein